MSVILLPRHTKKTQIQEVIMRAELLKVKPVLRLMNAMKVHFAQLIHPVAITVIVPHVARNATGALAIRINVSVVMLVML